MRKITVTLDIINNVAKNNNSLLRDAFKAFNNKRVTVTIQEALKSRSNKQNSYYWGCIIPIIKQGFKDSWGESFSTEHVHEFLKLQLNYIERVNEITGECIKFPKSTTDNDTRQQEEYHEAIRQFAFDWFNVIIQLPNEDLKLEL